MIQAIFKFNEHALDYPQFLFCGSFNPMHAGHIAIAEFVYKKFEAPVDFEISLHNVEKFSIDLEEVKRRYNQMFKLRTPAFGRLYITDDDARYLEKAYQLPEVTFICGFDTIRALCDGRYYKSKEFEMAIQEFNELGIEWLVFPRKKEDGNHSAPDDFRDFPPDLLKNITIVTSDEFPPIDIASRELRGLNTNL